MKGEDCCSTNNTQRIIYNTKALVEEKKKKTRSKCKDTEKRSDAEEKWESRGGKEKELERSDICVSKVDLLALKRDKFCKLENDLLHLMSVNKGNWTVAYIDWGCW